MAELEQEQQNAAHEIGKHVALTAGPGSGKTTVLVERYLHILRTHKLSIDQIVAITFTNRAANEMRERLRDKLDEILKVTDGDDRRHWLNYKRTLDGAVITTIHGFCARLLREFPVEAHVDPQFILLDEHRAAMLLEGVVEEVLSEFISAGHVEVSRLTLGIGRSKLAAGLAQLYRDVRGQGLSLPQLAMRTAESHVSEVDHSKALVELDAAMSAFGGIRVTTPAARENHSTVVSRWTSFRSFIQTIPEHETLADYCNSIEEFRKIRPDARGNIADHVRLLDELIWAKELASKVPQVCFDMFASRYALEMISLLTRIHDRLNEEKQKVSALDFDDLESRTLELLQVPEVLVRAAERYKFFLVDEFQDTNSMQRQLLEKLALSKDRKQANLFIVGDRKQSIYGFRGADVDVFREMTALLLKAGGEKKELLLNFRSQPPLIHFFNHLFSRLFRVPDDAPRDLIESLGELGFVDHETSVPKRELTGEGPLVEMLVTAKVPLAQDPRAEQDLPILDATQLANRIRSLIETVEGLRYQDIALLFRAMTKVHIYEATFRRANIPYQTILGRGFYEREEITDLVQLLRFLDNKTDELGLAAVLRSPLCGISDNALLALRCAPRLVDADQSDPSRALASNRPLFFALRNHDDIAFINEGEHALLDRARDLIGQLIARRHHYSIEDLLRFAVDESEYAAVVAANFDGAQRLANLHRLFTLAARFERSGHHLIRDFVRYVEEFEAIGSRESEGQIDETANAVRLMTIHQAKGLEFPVVIIPDLQRPSRAATDTWVLLDRHRGLTLKVPDGRGRQVAGSTFSKFEARHALREQFESMRLLYVAATRAKDRLILSGATDELSNLAGKNDSWLKWIWQALELQDRVRSDLVKLSDDVSLQLIVNLGRQSQPAVAKDAVEEDSNVGASDSLSEAFPLLATVPPDREHVVHRFSVTQLINYQRCPRQYYFDRVLRLPSADELSVWNNAEAPEPPANLTATLKGAVIHRFCERYSPDVDVEQCLRQSFDEVVRLRQAELADRLVEIDPKVAVKDLLPLAQNYLASDVFRRVEVARTTGSADVSSATEREARTISTSHDASADGTSAFPVNATGLWSELSFRLRRPLGVLSGAIDKLLITRSDKGDWEVELIDFKTNRIVLHSPSVAITPAPQSKSKFAQFAFDFESAAVAPVATLAVDSTLPEAVLSVAKDYQLQMQSYALAVRELLPSLENARIRVTLHFLEPNLEFQLSADLVEANECERVIDAAMLRIISSSEPRDFPVITAPHCRMCNFLRVCTAGREWIRNQRQAH